MLFPIKSIVIYSLSFAGLVSYGQAVSPVIVDYIGKAEGRLALSNNTANAMAVVLEPRSFSIAADGTGLYRSLDPEIHVQLSTRSVRLEPGQTQYVFYKARADKLPAWFTISSTFSPRGQEASRDVRLLLPHTVYIHSKRKHKKDGILMTRATYLVGTRRVICEFSNDTPELIRVDDIRFTSMSTSITYPGFPLLPGAKRHVELAWKESDPPREVIIHVEQSTVSRILSTTN